MHKIICPNCKESFSIEEPDYLLIASQVRNEEYRKDIEERKRDFENQMEQAVEKARLEEQLRLTKDISEKAQQIVNLQNEKETLVLDYENRLKISEEQLEFYKDMKIKMSTKMIGETLEKHCENMFEKVRAIGFQSAEFGKDNDSKSGSKGDYIFRDFDENGLEYISIMFEMKNEMDTTATKHKNKDFFKELDKDRTEKKCEYAVLVSMLESDNDYYNDGIVDVSHEYPKMYVIRPQFFIPIITLLRNTSRNALGYKQQIEEMRQQQLDVEHFEENLQEFKDDIAKKYRLGQSKLDDSIAQVQKAIDALEKVKTDLEATKDKLRLADSKAEKVTLKKLTKDTPAVSEMLNAGKK